jgi:PHD/YefM family antitoxin component YafN of YafNO toxin-antitoxin module
MPAILPIRDLKNTAKISALCKETDAPVFITKNGYGDMVVMSMGCYERSLARLDVFDRLDEAERQLAAGQTRDAFSSLAELREKHHV